MQYDKMSPCNNATRIAFVDLLFCWPAKGGADVDLYHVAAGLKDAGFTVHVFVLHFEGMPGRGQISTPSLPFPYSTVSVPANATHAHITTAITAAVDAWGPSMVILSHGYALKVRVACALAHYPLVGRYYAHELLCLRNALRFKEGAPCSYDYLAHPDHCRACAMEYLKAEITSGAPRAFAQDFLLAGAYTKEYYHIAIKALNSLRAIIVSNDTLRDELGPYAENSHVIPGGISDSAFTTPQHAADGVLKIIFMAGRVEDPLKGLNTLRAAGTLLRRKRNDFQLVATHFDHCLRDDDFAATGWLTHEETLAWYAKADICVVPSLWHEPFGLVAVEAMAAGIPVCAADTGGLRDIVVHGETGFRFPPGDAAALAGYLEILLDNESMRRAFGAAGKQRAQEHYTWDVIVARHYAPLIRALAAPHNPAEGKTS